MTCRSSWTSGQLPTRRSTTDRGAGDRRVRRRCPPGRGEAVGKTPAELRQLAEEADYLAERVYGKSVQDDAEFKRVERFRQRAKVFRQFADGLAGR